MIIREAVGHEDIRLIIDIYRSDMGRFGLSHTEDDLVKIESDLDKEFSELGKNRIVLIGFESGHPIGTVGLIFADVENDLELADGKSIANIHHLRVAYDLHKTGRGKKLMETIEQIAIKRGFSKLTLAVDDWNKNAIDFYLHLGYKILKTNNQERTVYMYKEFK